MISVHPILKAKYNFNLLSGKNYLRSMPIIYATLLSVIASYCKTVLLSNIFNISQLTLRSYAFICPFITLLLCHIFLKDQKLSKSYIFAFATVFGGFMCFNINTTFTFTFSTILILYVFLNGYSDYKLKSVSHKRGFEMMFFDNLMFLCVSTVVFVCAYINEDFTKGVFGIEKFDISKLLNTANILPLLGIALLSFMAHNLKMLSYKAKHIVGIIIVGIFFKSINSIIMTYLENSTLPNLMQCIGLVVMCIGLSVFMYNNFSKIKKNS